MLGSLRRTSSSVSARCRIYLPRSVGVHESINNGSGQRGVVPLRSPPTDLNLFVLVLGDSPPSMFPITARASYFVGNLKDRVYAKTQNRLKGIDAHDLTLWKLKVSMPGDEADAGVAALGENLSGAAHKMAPTKKLGFYFPSGVDDESIHIVVEPPSLPPTGQRHSLFGDGTDGDALRVRMPKRRRLDHVWIDGSKTIYKSESDPNRPNETPQLPSTSNFNELANAHNIIAADKTIYIEYLDKNPQYQLMFLRPRRWGKTTFLHMLADYYDLTKAHEFDNTFGRFYIGKNPTADRSSLLVLLFDFSAITTVDPQEAKHALNDTVLYALRKFLKTNEQFLGYPTPESLLGNDGTNALRNVLDLVANSKQKLFVGVDEYDAPANACLFSENIEDYHAISNYFQTRFFSIMKQAIGFSIQKYWLTGVLPAFWDGFSPLSATKNISMSPQYHNACGLTENEVRGIAKAYLATTHDEAELDKELATMKRWFDGHKFYPSGYDTDVPSLYNPPLVFTHLRTVSRKAGHEHLAEELNTTNVLNAIKDDGDMNVHDLLQLLSGNLQGRIMTAFGVPELKGIGRHADITWSLLYYFGAITRGKGEELLILNLTMRYLIIRRFWEYLKTVNPAFATRMRNSCAAFINGNHSPLVEVLEEFLQKRPERSVFDSNENNWIAERKDAACNSVHKSTV